jgi:hypothetical protein
MPEDSPGKIERLRPSDTPEYMTPAWLGCISFALGQPELLQAFRADTGNHWTPASTGIDRLIDQATGADWQFIEAFILWVNDNVWGPLDGPADDPD